MEVLELLARLQDRQYPTLVAEAVDCLPLEQLEQVAQVAVEMVEQAPREALEVPIPEAAVAGQHLLAEQITRAQTAVQAWSSLKPLIP